MADERIQHMDPQALREEVEHLKELIKVHTKTLRALELQAAKFGIYVPPFIQIEIDEIKLVIHKYNNIVDTKEHLSFLLFQVDILEIRIKRIDLEIDKLERSINSNNISEESSETEKQKLSKWNIQRRDELAFKEEKESDIELLLWHLSEIEKTKE
jgi:hypothetical protein